jgi:hypothetical protein
MTKSFASGTLSSVIKASGLTAKEFGATNTFISTNELANGGAGIAPDNATVGGIWSGLHRNRGIAEKILLYIDDVDFHSADKAAAYKAYAKFFKAMTTGYMTQYWEKVTLENNDENNASFVSRNDGLQEAVSLLKEAQTILAAHPDAVDIINNLVSFEFSINDIINAYIARYEIELGHYQEAFDAADAVDLTARSVWSYDGGSIQNPIYKNVVDPSATLSYKSLDSLGLVATQTPELGDMRNDFYLDYINGNDVNCGKGIDNPEGFWATETTPIPVYLPGEMLLIKAEAKARMGGASLADAVTLINQVRTKTNDVFNVNASLAAWTGNATDQTEVLDEIYKNYAIELYMQGQRFPIHRRFFPNYLNSVDWNTANSCGLERVNNFYPYPDKERSNNPNCPADPAY